MMPTGPCPSPLMLVGEFMSVQDEQRGEPFQGNAGMELNRMLTDAGIMRATAFATYVIRARPPTIKSDGKKAEGAEAWMPKAKKDVLPHHIFHIDRYIDPVVKQGIDTLFKEIERCQPKVIVAFGNVALWALTGKWGIKSWRGSRLQLLGHSEVIVIPCYHPSYVLRDWSQRQITVHDLKRVIGILQGERETRSDYQMVLRSDYATTCQTLEKILALCDQGPTPLAADIETRAYHTACLGIAWSAREAICIPLVSVEKRGDHWTLDEEASIMDLARRCLTHPNAFVAGQNFLYDMQYLWREFRFIPNLCHDTMLAQHVLFAGMEKRLDFISSMYTEDHVYWKDDGKEWNEKIDEIQYWNYNALDCCRTFEIMENQLHAIAQAGLGAVNAFQQELVYPALRAMILGCRVDLGMRQQLSKELFNAGLERQFWIDSALGHALNTNSPKQMQTLFYGDLGQQPVISRKTNSPSCDDESLSIVGKREPLLLPITSRIQQMRSLGKIRSSSVEAKLDVDKRMRCMYDPSGTETYRFNSKKNAFGGGANLQNWTKGNQEEGELALPNVRKLIIPDPDMVLFDGDLDRADLYVVVWEADDEELRKALQAGVDLHLLNAGSLFDLPISLEQLRDDPDFVTWCKRTYGKERQFGKSWVHGTNYGGKDRTMAATVGITVKENEKLRLKWFGEHPGIQRWHDRTEHQLKVGRTVWNKFGYRRVYFDRVEGLLPQALAWVPQSTVACYINRVWRKIYDSCPHIPIQLQVHDSLVGQFRRETIQQDTATVKALAGEVVVPYTIPLVIPFSIKWSDKSWGHCE